MATREIKTKFKIEGIDKFKSGVSSANSALALHKSELAKVEALAVTDAAPEMISYPLGVGTDGAGGRVRRAA